MGSGPFLTELHDDVGEKMRKIGMEFGATTGRPRRCGWIDIPQLKYTCMINGVTDIVITKLDVLDEFEEIKYCENYDIDGKLSDRLPFDITHAGINPTYTAYEGWHSSLDDVVTYDQLPAKASGYVDTLQQAIGVKISMVSTGPERRKILHK